MLLDLLLVVFVQPRICDHCWRFMLSTVGCICYCPQKSAGIRSSIVIQLTVGIGHEFADIEAIDNLLSLENMKS